MVRRPSSRAYAGQWVLLLVVVAIAWLITSDAADNLARRNMGFGFGFLGDRANFDIPFHLVSWVDSDVYGRTLLVCFLNTLLVSAMSVVTATLLGLLVGIMRLSINWLVRNVALVFIEFVRNTPQLIQIIFWYVAVLQTLPAPRASIVLPGDVLLNIRGFYLPDAIMRPQGSLLGWIALALLAATPFAWRLKIGDARVGAQGADPAAARRRRCWPSASITSNFRPSRDSTSPAGSRCRPSSWRSGPGSPSTPPLSSPRSCAAPSRRCRKGQREAALSLGLRSWQRMFLVVLPQALRIMVPQLTSQYLNIIKSSTLGAAVAYPELVQIFVGTVQNQSGKELETTLIVMGIFLAISLLTSAFMNWYNRHVALVER